MANIIFFGPPGAGKGTQAKFLSDKLAIPHLSTGDILRAKILIKDELGLKVKDIISNGKLVPDDILNSIVSQKLLNDSKKGFILDGYPRTLIQSEFITNFFKKNNLEINLIFNINLDFKILQNRILKRAKEENREDDSYEVLKTRYDEYSQTTMKVSNYFENTYKSIFYKIDGDQDISEISSKILKIVENMQKSGKI